MFYLFNQVRYQKHSDWRKFFNRRLSFVIPCVSVFKIRNFLEVLLFLFCSFLELVFLSHYKLEFLHHELNLKHNTCRGVLRRKTVLFVRCIRMLIVPNFQKQRLSIIFLHIQTHPTLSPATTGFNSSTKFLKKSFAVGKTFSIVNLSILLIALAYWPFDNSNVAIYCVSFQYWNS